MTAKKPWEPEQVKPRTSGTSADGTPRTIWQVRWTHPDIDGRPSYTKLVDEPDGEQFRLWLTEQFARGERIGRNDPRLETWRGTPGAGVHGDTGSRVRPVFGLDYARANIDGRRGVSDRRKHTLHQRCTNWFAEVLALPMASVDEQRAVQAIDDLGKTRMVCVNKKTGTFRPRTLAASSKVEFAWCLRGFFKAAFDDGTIPTDPFANIKLGKPENAPRRLTEDEFDLSDHNYSALMLAAGTTDRATVELLQLVLNTGLRIGEALGLQVHHIDRENNCIRVRQQLNCDGKRKNKDLLKPVKRATEIQKSSSRREVPLQDSAMAALVAWLRHAGIEDMPGAFVFARPRSIRHGEPWKYTNWHRNRWSVIHRRAQEEFGMTRVSVIPNGERPFRTTPHCLRHTFASRMLRTGKMTLAQVGTVMGHQPGSRTLARIYEHSGKELLHAHTRAAAALAFPAPVTGLGDAAALAPPVTRNGWFVDPATGKKVRRSRTTAA